MPKIARSKHDLVEGLRDQFELLCLNCESFDRGSRVVAKQLAVSLRLLLHDTKNQRSLLEQLGMRSGRFLDTAGKIDPANMISSSTLVSMQIGPESASYIPRCISGFAPPDVGKMVAFADWWNEPVVKDGCERLFCRRDLIKHVADTDGGAHVDPALDEAYADLSRNNSLGWVLHSKGIETALPGPELDCIRQITHEVVMTFHKRDPSLFRKAYVLLSSGE